MQFQHTSTLPQLRVPGRRLALAAGGAALLAAAAIGGWQALDQSGSRTVQPVESSIVTSVPVAAPAPAVTLQASARPLTVYLAPTQQEADRIRGAVADGNLILASLGQPPFEAAVVVVADAEEEQMLTAYHNETNAIRDAMGLAPLPLISVTGR